MGGGVGAKRVWLGGEFMTDGYLVREMMSDPLLSKYRLDFVGEKGGQVGWGIAAKGVDWEGVITELFGKGDDVRPSVIKIGL